MGNFELAAIIFLVMFAVGDLIVGVVNDAVNFLNSAIGSKVAKRATIMIVASIGIIIGATFSDGIIEITRKGIFYPDFFTIKEVILVFTAVALTDIILLDLYSTFGLPTSTTVSVIFEILGAAFIAALWKTGTFEQAWTAINGDSATKILVSIVLSVAIAFVIGLIAQFITRLFFTFDYRKGLRRWGFLWSAMALTSLVFFILIKGGKNATFMTPALESWIKTNTMLILESAFVIFALISFVLIRLRVKILKLIVLIGTGSLAMAFAGNDLANFIGVAVSGVHAYFGADLSADLSTPTWALLGGGIIMAVTMAISKKAMTVTDTEVNLASHEKEVMHSWKSSTPMVKLVDVILFVYRSILWFIPVFIQEWMKKRWAVSSEMKARDQNFDKVRAAVNLMVSAAVISYGTSYKLPLSTTFVTFMVAMGTAVADGAWTRECAPSRLMGVMTVLASWFVTGIFAFTAAGIVVSVLIVGEAYGLALLVVATTAIVYKLMVVHKKRRKAAH